MEVESLFGDLVFVEKKKEPIRTLGFYEPFGSLMLKGKIETRWVDVTRKPPFPLGKYVFYTTKKPCSNPQLFEWSGAELMATIINLLKDGTRHKNGYAIAVGELVELYPMAKVDEGKGFVLWAGLKLFVNPVTKKATMKKQWCLKFDNVKAIEPFEFKFGKQGVGILHESEHHKIKVLSGEQ